MNLVPAVPVKNTKPATESSGNGCGCLFNGFPHCSRRSPGRNSVWHKGLDQLDLVLFEFVPGSVTAGMFTQSHFAAAPVLVGREHLDQGHSRYFLINSGNANAATGDAGKSDAVSCCKALSQRTGVRPDEVIPFSTGVIGEKLQVAKITDALPALIRTLDETNWLIAAQGIMTTDTRPKIATRRLEIEGKAVDHYWYRQGLWNDSAQYGDNAGLYSD